MTREDCGKETKMESDAALEWIAQQCETTYPHEQNQGGCRQVAEPRGGCTLSCGTTIAEDQQGLCRWLRMDKLNGKAYATELVGTE